jgi:hypothetical protein
VSECSHCLWQWDSNSGCRFCTMVCPDFGLVDIYLSTPSVGRWGSWWVVMAACHCYWWWRWWSDALWVILTQLWLYSISRYLQICCCVQIISYKCKQKDISSSLTLQGGHRCEALVTFHQPLHSRILVDYTPFMILLLISMSGCTCTAGSKHRNWQSSKQVLYTLGSRL